jgi:hypothetical protein
LAGTSFSLRPTPPWCRYCPVGIYIPAVSNAQPFAMLPIKHHRQRCNKDASASGYPVGADCPILQSRGVHFSDAGKQWTGIMTAAAIAPYLY